MKTICAWCGKDMGDKDGEGIEGTSHGLCQECFERLKQNNLTTVPHDEGTMPKVATEPV
ncbi:hypothetical protein ACFLU4_07345 [Chloroflexota bacterium]